ncbi:MAG TPA: hypothetical protein VHZ95_00515 [Polyangiales bacterium]|nr:hypothetical protein [Polyangiales bacterium]
MRLRLSLSASLALLAACSGEASAPDRSAAGSGNAGFGNVTDNPISLSSCNELNLTQPCSCGSTPGRQLCDGALWSACECAQAGAAQSAGPDLQGNGRTDITFVWAKTPTSVDLGGCLPGNYEGTFGGLYWSYIATLAPISGLSVPIADIELPDAPSGFHFTVMPAEGGETVLKIKGVMDGNADLVFPFSADIVGELDCKTKTFTGQMINGMYSVLIQGLIAQSFTGVLNGDYDVRTHTFVNGTWDVWETSGMPPGKPAPMLPRDFDRDGFGGYGTFAAALPTDQTDPDLATCPTNFSCGKGPLGPNKYLCNSLLGPPGCNTDAECDSQFPAGSGVTCLKTTSFSTCLLECKP